MGRILLVEDTKDIQLVVKAALRDHTVVIAETITDADTRLKQNEFDLLILDLGLPDGHGLSFLSRLSVTNEASSPRATLLLTASNDIRDKSTGFALGAEDYLVKPFDPLELKLRVDRIFRSQASTTDSAKTLQLGNLRIELSTGRVIDSSDETDTLLPLTPFEFRMLIFFAEREDNVVSREHLLDSLWGNTVAVSERVVDSHISRLRAKLVKSGARIESVYGSGYRFLRRAAEAST